MMCKLEIAIVHVIITKLGIGITQLHTYITGMIGMMSGLNSASAN